MTQGNFYNFDKGGRRLDVTTNDRWLEDQVLAEFREDHRNISNLARDEQRIIGLHGTAREVPPEVSANLEIALRCLNREYSYRAMTGGGTGTMEIPPQCIPEEDCIGLSTSFLSNEQTSQRFGSVYSCDALMCVRRFGLTTLPDIIASAPGGFGTVNEFLEAIFLKMKGIIPDTPILLFESYAGFWKAVTNFVSTSILSPEEQAQFTKLFSIIEPDASPNSIREEVRKVHHLSETTGRTHRQWFDEQRFEGAYSSLERALQTLQRSKSMKREPSSKNLVGIFAGENGRWHTVSESVLSTIDADRQSILTGMASVTRSGYDQGASSLVVDSEVNPTANGIPWKEFDRNDQSRPVHFRTGAFEYLSRFVRTTAQQGALFLPHGLQPFLALSELMMLRQLGIVSKSDPLILADDQKGTFGKFEELLRDALLHRGGYISPGDDVIGQRVPLHSPRFIDEVRGQLNTNL